MCAPTSRTATPPGSDSCPPVRWRSCRCRTAARRSCGASRAPRRRACAPSMRRPSARRCARRAARCSGELRAHDAAGELSAQAAVCARLCAAARGAARRCRARGAPAGGAGIESRAAGLRVARRGARLGRRRRAASASTGCCAATSGGAKARICSPPPRSTVWSGCFRTPIRRSRGCAAAGLDAVRQAALPQAPVRAARPRAERRRSGLSQDRGRLKAAVNPTAGRSWPRR